MRILAISRTSPFHGIGGFEDHVRTLYSGLVSLGHSVTVLTTGHPDGIDSTILDGVIYRFIKETTPGKYSKSWWTRSAEVTQDILREKQTDLLHSQSYSGTEIFNQKLPKKFKVPSVVSFHGTSYDEYKTKNNLTEFEWKPLVPMVDYIRNYLSWR